MGRDGSGALPRVPSSGIVKATPVVVTSSRDHGGASTGGAGGGASAGGLRPPPVTSPAAAARQGSGSPNSAQPAPRQVCARCLPKYDALVHVFINDVSYLGIGAFLYDKHTTQVMGTFSLCTHPNDEPCLVVAPDNHGETGFP